MSLGTAGNEILHRALSESGSGRNEACFRMACQLRDNLMAEPEAMDTADAFAAEVGDRTFSRTEARAAVRSAYRRPPREPWRGLNSLISHISQPKLARQHSIARFRRVESERLMEAARDAARSERVSRRRAKELIRDQNFDSKDWKTIDSSCLEDQRADKLMEAADWMLTKATDAEVESHRRGVDR